MQAGLEIFSPGLDYHCKSMLHHGDKYMEFMVNISQEAERDAFKCLTILFLFN